MNWNHDTCCCLALPSCSGLAPENPALPTMTTPYPLLMSWNPSPALRLLSSHFSLMPSLYTQVHMGEAVSVITSTCETLPTEVTMHFSNHSCVLLHDIARLCFVLS